MNKQYTIFFGKNPEELDLWSWHDRLTDGSGNFSTELIWKETVGQFSTPDIDFLWDILFNLRENPPCMWYWVYELEDDKLPTLLCSGAIDYDDVYNLAENIECPDWAKDKLKIEHS